MVSPASSSWFHISAGSSEGSPIPVSPPLRGRLRSVSIVSPVGAEFYDSPRSLQGSVTPISPPVGSDCGSQNSSPLCGEYSEEPAVVGARIDALMSRGFARFSPEAADAEASQINRMKSGGTSPSKADLAPYKQMIQFLKYIDKEPVPETLQKEFGELEEATQFAVHKKIWELAGSPMDGDPYYGRTHLFDEWGRFEEALDLVLTPEDPFQEVRVRTSVPEPMKLQFTALPQEMNAKVAALLPGDEMDFGCYKDFRSAVRQVIGEEEGCRRLLRSSPKKTVSFRNSVEFREVGGESLSPPKVIEAELFSSISKFERIFNEIGRRKTVSLQNFEDLIKIAGDLQGLLEPSSSLNEQERNNAQEGLRHIRAFFSDVFCGSSKNPTSLQLMIYFYQKIEALTKEVIDAGVWGGPEKLQLLQLQESDMKQLMQKPVRAGSSEEGFRMRVTLLLHTVEPILKAVEIDRKKEIFQSLAWRGKDHQQKLLLQEELQNWLESLSSSCPDGGSLARQVEVILDEEMRALQLMKRWYPFADGHT